MLACPNFKMMFNFAIVSNITITTLKFVNKVGMKIYRNGVFEFKKATNLIFGLKNNFYIALWQCLANRFIQTFSQIQRNVPKYGRTNKISLLGAVEQSV